MLTQIHNSALVVRDRIGLALYEASALSISSLSTFAGVSQQILNSELKRCLPPSHPALVQVERGWHGQRVFSLTSDGFRFVQRRGLVPADESPKKSVPVSRLVFLNGILSRFVRKNGWDGLQWFYQQAATQALRSRIPRTSDLYSSEFPGLLLSTPVPDALLQTKQGNFWIEADLGINKETKLETKMSRYKETLPYVEAAFHQVVWVCPREDRCQFLQSLWQAQAIPTVNMRFFVAGKEEF